MPLQNIFIANCAPLIGLFVLFVFILKNTMFDNRKTLLFLFAIAVDAALILSVSVDAILTASAVVNIYVFRRVTTFLCTALLPCVSLVFFLAVRNKHTHWAIFLPAAVNVILCFISIFVPEIVFYISEANLYVKGAVFFFPHLVSAAYLVGLGIEFLHARSKSRMQTRLFLFFSVAVLFACMLTEIFAGYRFLFPSFSALLLILFYLLLTIQKLMNDTLTGCFNGRAYEKELSDIDHYEGAFIALLDVNGFTTLNDLFGYQEGDKRLIKFAEILQKNMAWVAKIYRIEGDKFVLISKKASSVPLFTALENARLTADQNGIEFACGVIEYRPADDIQDVIQQAGNIMYANKIQMKSTKNRENAN